MKLPSRSRARPVRACLAALALASALALSAQTPAPALPQPLTLDGALAYALEHNPGLLRTREQIREQEGVLVTVRAGQLPTVAASGSYSRMQDSLLESPLYENRNWTATLALRQALYTGGSTTANIRGQRERLESAKLAFTAASNTAVLSVRTQFAAVLLDHELIGVEEEAIRVLESELVNARHRQEAGTGSNFDVLRAEVAVANAKPALIRVRNAYHVAQVQLRATLGAPVSLTGGATDLALSGELAQPLRDVALGDALLAAHTHRPELLQQERVVRSADQAVTSAKAGYQPTVSASVGYEWMQPSLVTTPQSRLDGWTAGVQANWNIFDGRATAGRVAQARSQAAQARYGITETELAVEVEVRQAHAAVGEATELLASAEKVVDEARESLRLSQARFSAGTATQLDVLTAQSALTEARSNLAQAQYDYAVASAQLDRATGTDGTAR